MVFLTIVSVVFSGVLEILILAAILVSVCIAMCTHMDSWNYTWGKLLAEQSLPSVFTGNHHSLFVADFTIPSGEKASKIRSNK